MKQVLWAGELWRLEKLSTSELARSLKDSVGQERRRAVFVIAHLAVLVGRKGRLALGYSNLFDYCVDHLALSRGTVWSRLQVAAVAQRFPRVLEALFREAISLSVAGLLAAKLTAENVDELLARSQGKSKREVEELLVEYLPKRAVSPGVARRRASPSPIVADEATAPAEIFSPPSEPSKPRPRGKLEPVQPEVFNFRFAASQEFKDKLERLAEVVGIDDPAKNMAELFEKALEIALHHRDPKQRAERRAERAQQHGAERAQQHGAERAQQHGAERAQQHGAERAQQHGAERAQQHRAERAQRHGAERAQRQQQERMEQPQARRADAGPGAHVDQPRADLARRRRYIPVALREQVLERASHRCEYESPAGVRCTERTHLEIDHRYPYARGGTATPANLRVLCRAHNLYEAETSYGEQFIREKIEGRQLQT